MITLSDAFKLCAIGEESVYLRHHKAPWYSNHHFWSTKVRKKMDMRKIKVLKITPLFETYGPDYLGMMFTVCGVSEEELRKLEYACSMEG